MEFVCKERDTNKHFFDCFSVGSARCGLYTVVHRHLSDAVLHT